MVRIWAFSAEFPQLEKRLPTFFEGKDLYFDRSLASFRNILNMSKESSKHDKIVVQTESLDEVLCQFVFLVVRKICGKSLK